MDLTDVARRAGVSTNTVSRVVRDDPEVADATRKRIRALLDELNYKPNLAARALASNRTGVLHVLLATPLFHGHAQTFLAIMNASAQAGFHLSISNAHGLSPRDREYHGAVPMDVDGIIIVGGVAPAVDLATRLGEQTPTVLLMTGEHNLSGVSTVSVDNSLGERLATEHLIGLGMTSLVHLAGPSDWVDAVQRRDAFVAACEAAGIEPSVITHDSWEASAGYDLVLGMDEVPDGIVAANDQLAMGAMRALTERGISVPGQAKIIGFDGMAGTDYVVPPLSTVRQPFGRIGLTAVKHLRKMLDGAPAIDTVIEPELVIRASTAGQPS